MQSLDANRSHLPLGNDYFRNIGDVFQAVLPTGMLLQGHVILFFFPLPWLITGDENELCSCVSHMSTYSEETPINWFSFWFFGAAGRVSKRVLSIPQDRLGFLHLG
jgi:hypothetical protein